MSDPASAGNDTGRRLIADIGGTNARFALASNGSYDHERVLTPAEYPSLAAAARAYLDGLRLSTRPSSAVLAVAGYIEDDRATLINIGWSFSFEALRSELGLSELAVVNDFEAIALAVPSLVSPEDLQHLGGPTTGSHAAKAVLGPGTGLGVAGLLPTAKGWRTVPGEGGHATMPATDGEESRILGTVRDLVGHVSGERVLSGPGLENLYQAVCALEGKAPAAFSAAEISAHAVAGSDRECRRALDAFCAMLGVVAGNLALTLGAKGGVYIAGGIVPRFRDYFANSAFRKRFEAKGRMRPYLAAIPTFLIVHPNPGLKGMANYARPGE